MDRRKFSKNVLLSGMAIPAMNLGLRTESPNAGKQQEDVKKLALRNFDVIVAGGGTAGVVAAIAAGPA